MDDFEGYTTSVEEVTTNVEETAGELELEVHLKMGPNCWNRRAEF